MKRKGSMVKRVFAMLVLMTMFVTMLPSTPVYATDITAPVIESVEVVTPESGAPIVKGDDICLRVQIYDADASEIDWESPSLCMYSVEEDWSFNIHGGTYEKVEGAENEYLIYFENWIEYDATIKMVSLDIADVEGNETTYTFKEDYFFNVSEYINEAITITDVQFSTDTVILTDDSGAIDLQVIIEAEGECDEYGHFNLSIDCEGRGCLAVAYYDETTGKYIGHMTIGYGFESGEYILDSIKYNDDKILWSGEASVTVKKNITDKKAPVINDVWIEVNGEKASGGMVVTDEDVVKVYADVEDESEITYLAVDFYTDLENIEETHFMLHLEEYDEDKGCYWGEITVAELYATEWYVWDVGAEDKYANFDHERLDEEMIKYMDKYFYVKREDTCSIPTSVIGVYDNNYEYLGQYTITRVTTLKDIFGDNIPTASKEGKVFKGWHFLGLELAEDTPFIPSLFSRDDLFLEAVFDKNQVEVEIVYIDAKGYRQNVHRTWTMDYGVTYDEVMAKVNTVVSADDLYTGFLGWGDGEKFEVNGFEGDLVGDVFFYVYAIYEKNYVFLDVEYIDEELKLINDQIKFELTDKYSNWDDVWAEVDQTKYVHNEELGFLNWNTEELRMPFLDPYGYVTVSATYEKFPVTITYAYYDTDNNRKEESVTLTVTEGTTYNDILDILNEMEIEHSADYGFENWAEISWDMETEVSAGEEIYVTAEYANSDVFIDYTYYTEFLREKTKTLAIIVEDGTTYGEIIETYLANVKHPEVLGFKGWKTNDDLSEVVDDGANIEVVAEYTNYVVNIEAEYAAVSGEVDYAEFRVAVKPGTTYGEIISMISCTHYEGLNFVKWNLEDDETDTVAAHKDSIYVTPVYDKAFVVLGYWHCDKNMRYDYATYIELVDPETTYEQVTDLYTEQVVHGDGLTVKEWEWYEEKDTKCGTGIVYIDLVAVYDQVLADVWVEYINEENEASYEVYFYVADGTTTTYQDIFNHVNADFKHSADYKFVEWDYQLTDDKALSDIIVDDGTIMEMIATYQQYPLKFTYTYLTKDGTIKSVTEEMLVAAGTKFEDLLNKIVLPSDARDAEVIGWYGDVYLEESSEVITGYTSWQVCAEYVDLIPVSIYLETIGADHNVKNEEMVLYVAGQNLGMYEIADLVIDVIDEKDTVTAKDLGQIIYEWRGATSGRECFEAYHTIPTLNMFTQMDKAVVMFEYPDGTKENVLVDVTEDYVLPKTHGGHNIKWVVTDIFYYVQRLDGGEELEIYGPYVEVQGTYTDYVIPEVPVEPENPIIPEEPEKPEEPAKPAVKLEEEVIKEEVSKIEKAEENTTVVIDMKKEDGTVATEIPVEVLEAAKGKDIEVVVDMGEYSWTINGNDIAASKLESINLEVTLDTEAIAPSVVEKLAGGDETRQISLTHNGDFGFKAQLTLNVGKENVGEYGNLYYYDSNNKLVFMNSGIIDENGNVSLSFTHASDYVVVIGADRTADEIEKLGDLPSTMPIAMLFVGAMFVLVAVLGKKKIVK